VVTVDFVNTLDQNASIFHSVFNPHVTLLAYSRCRTGFSRISSFGVTASTAFPHSPGSVYPVDRHLSARALRRPPGNPG